MFCALITVCLLFTLMLLSLSLSLYDLQRFNFGLYYVILCVVGMLISCALCIAKPNLCPNPLWYDECCLQMSEYQAEEDIRKEESRRAKSMGLREASRQIRMLNAEARKKGGETAGTFQMLGPAMHLMHNVWRGMAWVQDEIQGDMETSSDHRTHKSSSGGKKGQDRELSMIKEDSFALEELDVPSEAVRRASIREEDLIEATVLAENPNDAQGSPTVIRSRSTSVLPNIRLSQRNKSRLPSRPSGGGLDSREHEASQPLLPSEPLQVSNILPNVIVDEPKSTSNTRATGSTAVDSSNSDSLEDGKMVTTVREDSRLDMNHLAISIPSPPEIESQNLISSTSLETLHDKLTSQRPSANNATFPCSKSVEFLINSDRKDPSNSEIGARIASKSPFVINLDADHQIIVDLWNV